MIFAGDIRTQVTVLAAGTASGDVLIPFILYDGALLLTKWFDNTLNQVCIDRNSSGIIDEFMFCSYVKKVVILYLEQMDSPSRKVHLIICDY